MASSYGASSFAACGASDGLLSLASALGCGLANLMVSGGNSQRATHAAAGEFGASQPRRYRELHPGGGMHVEAREPFLY